MHLYEASSYRVLNKERGTKIRLLKRGRKTNISLKINFNFNCIWSKRLTVFNGELFCFLFGSLFRGVNFYQIKSYFFA